MIGKKIRLSWLFVYICCLFTFLDSTKKHQKNVPVIIIIIIIIIILFCSFSGTFPEAKRGRVNAMLKIRPCKVSYHPPQCQSSGALSYTLNSILRYVIVYFFKKDIKIFV